MPGAKLQFADLKPVGTGTPTGRYLRLFWQPVARARDLKAGRAKPVEILGEKFTLYHGEHGGFRVVAFRCPHRGAQLPLAGWRATRCAVAIMAGNSIAWASASSSQTEILATLVDRLLNTRPEVVAQASAQGRRGQSESHQRQPQQ